MSTEVNDVLKQAQDEYRAKAIAVNAGRKPKFGELMRNPWASEDNPTRDGYFVRARVVKGRFNPGTWYEMTDRNGKFWEVSADYQFFVEPAAAVPVNALPDQSEFERQARYQGATNFAPARDMQCDNGWFPATYQDPMTELAWRVWANKRAAVEADRAQQQDMSVRLAGAPAGQHDSSLTNAEAWEIASRLLGTVQYVSREEAFVKVEGPEDAGELARAFQAELATRCRAEGGDGAPEAVSADRAQQGEPHDDDIAWEHFASATKAKMAEGREKGRGGWEDPEQCPTERLQLMLLEHLKKGDPVDVANFCMMLWTRGEPVVAVDLKAARQAVLEDAAAICDNFAKRDMHPAECAGAIRMMKDSIK